MAVKGDGRPSYYIRYSKEIPIFVLFLVVNSYFFPIFGGMNSYFPIFLTIPITWRPDSVKYSY